MGTVAVPGSTASAVPVQPWIPVNSRLPFLATGSDLSEQVYVAQLRDGYVWQALRARQTADRAGWMCGKRALAWAPTHWTPVPEIERKLKSMLAGTLAPSLRLPDFQFEMVLGLDEHGAPRGDGPGVVTVRAPRGEILGRIAAGMLYPVPRCHADLVGRIVQAAREPMPEALRYARYTAICCFCGRALTDPTSRKLGYGPTCRGYAAGASRR